MSNFESLNTFQRVNYILTNVQFGIGVLGTVGNLLVILVYSRKSLRKYSYAFYSQIKAVGDIIVLYNVFRAWANFILGANLNIVNSFFCAISTYTGNVPDIFCQWILCLISLDRLLTIVYPNRFKIFKKLWFQILMSIVVLIYSLLASLMNPLNTTLREVFTGTTTIRICSAVAKVLNDFSYIYISNILVSILLINNIINFKMIRYIMKSRKRIATNSTNSQTSYKDRKFAITAVSLGLIAVVCKLPVGIRIIIANSLSLSFDVSLLLIISTTTILALENASAFYVNFLLNPAFKEEFFRMIGLKGQSTTQATDSVSSKKNITTRMSLR